MSTNGIRREGGEQGSRWFHWCGGSIEGDEKAEEEEGAQRWVGGRVNHREEKRKQEYKGDQSADVRSGRLHEGARKGRWRRGVHTRRCKGRTAKGKVSGGNVGQARNQ